MPKVHPIQNDFTAGILSPRMHARSDVDGFRSGLSDCVNFVTLKQGPVDRRPGTKYLQTLSGNVHRVFAMELFPDSEIGESFCVLVDDTNVEVLGATGLTSGKEIVSNPEFAGGLSPWDTNTTGSATVVWQSTGVAMVAGQAGYQVNYCEVTQQVAITSGKENDDHELYVSHANPYPAENRTTWRIMVGTSESADDIYSSTIDGTFNPGGNTSVWITFRVYSNFKDTIGTPTEPGDTYSDREILYSMGITETDSSDVVFPHSWTEDEVRKIRSAQSPEEQTIYFATGDSAPRMLEYDSATDTWTFDLVSFSSQPSEWSDANGWPSTMTFYQGRSWWSGHKLYPNRIWASKSRDSVGDYFDMNLGTALDNEAIDTIISKRGKILWMEPLGNTMVVGTNNAEFAMVSESGVVTPSDIAFDEQSNNGSGQSQPIKAGNFVIYVSADGRKMYNLIYRWSENAWRSRDMTFSAEHLTVNSPISRIAYSKNPENLIWSITSSAELLGCTFDPATELLGWHRHDLGGDLIDIASVDNRGTSSLFVVVRRELSKTSTTLEYIESASDVYLDTHVKFNDTLSISVPHLADTEVSVIADGYLLPNVTLNGGGEGTAVSEVIPSEMIVGLPYESSITTLPADPGYVSGSMMTLNKRWNKAYAYITDSAYPQIEGQRPAARSFDSIMDGPEPLYTGLVNVTLTGYQELGKLTISQDLPLATTINSILGELNASNL